ncbi:MAG: enoyl-CoA hydratase-related protein [Methylocystis sp.]
METRLNVSREGGVLRILFDRPEKKNALTREMYLQALAALEEASAEESLCAVYFCGAGGTFTAGNDIADFLAFSGEPSEFPALRFIKALACFEKPLVAAVAGDAVGIGVTMLFHCDLVYASPSSSFRAAFIDLGLPPEGGVSLLAPRRFGAAKAAELLMLGDSFDAKGALRLGFVNEILAEEELQARALDSALRLAAKPPTALRETRRLLQGEKSELLSRMDEEARLFAQALASAEVKARFAAFLKKSPR